MIRRLCIALAILSIGSAAALSAEPHKRELRQAIEVGEVGLILLSIPLAMQHLCSPVTLLLPNPTLYRLKLLPILPGFSLP